MIRDPSDGTVRKPRGESPLSRSEQSVQVAEGANSGLPIDKLKAEEQARLERSRDWLKNRIQSTTEQSSAPLRSPTSGEG